VAEERDIERLVRAVTDLVLERLEGRAKRSPAARGVVLLLFPMPPARRSEIPRRVDIVRRAGWEAHVVADSPDFARAPTGAPCGEPNRALQGAELPATPPRAEARGSEPGVRRHDGSAIVVGSLGFAFARRLAGLDDDDPFVRLVARALLDGRPVIAVADDLAPRGAGAGGEAARRGDALLRDLERLGIAPVAAADLETVLGRIAETRTTASRSAGGLLTEADVVRLREAGETRLVLPPRTIVTPLARSRAAELGLELVEAGRD
jgi:hypothetical protein